MPLLNILGVLAPLAGKATEVLATYATLQRQGSTLELEEQVRRLEAESVRSSDVLRTTTQQLIYLAEQVRAQQRRAWWILGASVVAMGISVAALIAATGQ